jgi:hypothetical protein
MAGLILIGSVLALLLTAWLAGWRHVARGTLAVLGGYAVLVIPFVLGINLFFADAVFGPGAVWDMRFVAFLLFLAGTGALGGFTAAALARRRPVLHAAALALFVTAFATISFFSAPPDEPRWTRVAAQAALVPAVLAGGVLWRRGRG